MSRIKNGKTEDGKTKWIYFRKKKLSKKSKLRRVMWIARMVCISKLVSRKIEEKRKTGKLVTKTIQYGNKK